MGQVCDLVGEDRITPEMKIVSSLSVIPGARVLNRNLSWRWRMDFLPRLGTTKRHRLQRMKAESHSGVESHSTGHVAAMCKNVMAGAFHLHHQKTEQGCVSHRESRA